MGESQPEFWIGTSGWQYDDWRGRFYPKEVAKKDWFSYYAGRFSTVELNSSFYRQPKQETWQAWHDAAAPGFRFAVKANRFLTHMKRFKDCEEPLKRFLEGAELLKSYLGPILYQAPPNFHRTPENQERLDEFSGTAAAAPSPRLRISPCVLVRARGLGSAAQA